jgi:protein-disulfide isomerase
MNTPVNVKTPEAGLAAADHAQGDAQAKHTLLQYGDYECPACIAAEPQVQQLVAAHLGRLRFVFRHFPWVELHPHAELAAESAEAAAAQGHFWPMHRLLFAQTQHLSPPALEGYAQSIGLDMNRFKAELADRIYTQRVQEHRRSGERDHVHATPAFFLDGRAVDVSRGFDALEVALSR